MFYNRFTNRREMMKSTMALFAAGLLGKGVPMAEAQSSVQNVNKHSSPSTLKITDLRYTVVKKPGPSPCPLIRIDTNQGVYGLGEVRDVANYQYAMVLKSRIMGENPLNVDYLFEKIAQFGGGSAPGRRRLRHRDGVVGHRRARSTTRPSTRCSAASGATRFASTPTHPRPTRRRPSRQRPKAARIWE